MRCCVSFRECSHVTTNRMILSPSEVLGRTNDASGWKMTLRTAQQVNIKPCWSVKIHSCYATISPSPGGSFPYQRHHLCSRASTWWASRLVKRRLCLATRHDRHVAHLCQSSYQQTPTFRSSLLIWKGSQKYVLDGNHVTNVWNMFLMFQKYVQK